MNKYTLCLLALLLWPPKADTADHTIRIVDSPWLPYYGQFLPDYGLVPRIVTEAFKNQGWRVNYSFMSWTRALDEVKKGHFDAVATASFTTEREKYYHYTKPFLDSNIVFYKRRDSSLAWSTLNDLKGYRIGVLKGYSYSPEFDKAEFLKKIPARSEVLSFKKLFYKQADLIIMDQIVGNFTIREKLFGREKIAFESLEPPVYSDKLHLMFSKKVPDAEDKIEAFNRGLENIRKNGVLADILKEYGVRN